MFADDLMEDMSFAIEDQDHATWFTFSMYDKKYLKYRLSH